ncbi:LuxR C-terminal-related transcriptional regulator [Streptomyces sp. JHA26]|uniref:LuxR C-terminal-related transcriptional regulator n=1 Tax=Streptomyces sp. JHA26 TaxID=1917143 RepID=UPI000989D2AB|nr:LuxR C-terminal-related transcriptional regulator [Streptomyces sp. JHA26]
MVGPTAAAARLERRTSGIQSLCRAGLDADALHDGFLYRLRTIMPVDAAFFATVDPATLLFTSAVAEEPLDTATSLFLENEFGRRDVNKFAVLAETAPAVSSLDQATGGERARSARYREVMAPLGLGDELRAALVIDHHCWGVLCLHREDSPTGFSADEVTLVRRLAPHLAGGLRRAVTGGAFPSPPSHSPASSPPPGIVVLDDSLTVVSVNAEAEQWLADLTDHRWPGSGTLPAALHAAAAQLLFTERADPVTCPPPAAVRLRGRSGRWLCLHASRLQDPAGPRIGVVIQAVPPAELGSALLSAYGLTKAQLRVAALILKGRSTREIVTELYISANTVQEHLTAIFDKLGVRNRQELIATLLATTPPGTL